jgi:hypothetical protein
MTAIQLERLRSVLESQLKELGTLRRHQNIAVEKTPDPLAGCGKTPAPRQIRNPHYVELKTHVSLK